MSSKKSPTTREIIRAISGISVDPLAEKFVAQLISRYRKNRGRGQNKTDSLSLAARDLVEALTGFHIPAGRKPRTVSTSTPHRSPPRAHAKPAPPQEESDDAIMARLKAELDRRNAERGRS